MLTGSLFRPVTLADRAFFLAHYANYPQVHSDNSFANIVCWNHFAHYTYAYVNDAIILSSTIDGQTKFRPPIGERDPDLLDDVIRLAVDAGDDAPLALIDAGTRDWIREIYPGLPLHPDRAYFEYVYQTRDLSALSGSKFLTIRRHLNRFRRDCDPLVEPVNEENFDGIRNFLVEWCEWKQCNGHPFLGYEKDAMLFAIDHFRELDLHGLFIEARGKVGAIAIFEELNPSTAVVHFEKGLPDCEGIYKAINAETAAYLKNRYEFINRESDMGVPGLREAKMRYHPHHLVEVYYAERADLEKVI